MSYQKIVIVGNLGADARRGDLRGEPVFNFNVAVTERWNKAVIDPETRLPKIEKNERTTWFQCAAFGKRWVGVSAYLRKGQQVLIEADRIEARWYPDKQSNQPILTLNLTVSDIKLLGSADRPSSGEAAAAEAVAGEAPDYYSEMAAAGGNGNAGDMFA